MARKKIAVLFGGASSEHEISLLSAYNVLTNIPKNKYNVMCIGITKKGHWLYYPGEYEDIRTGAWENNPDCCTAVISPDAINKGIILIGESAYVHKVDVVFPVLHGANGEDGTVQGLCALAGLPCVGSDMTSSAACMDKTITHTILEAVGIRTAPYVHITKEALADIESTCDMIESRLGGYPMFVKPASAGSSVGVSRAANREALKNGIMVAFAHSVKVLIETEIRGKEVECAVLGNSQGLSAKGIIASIPGQITSETGFYDYDGKYSSGSKAVLDIPAKITPEETEELREIAKKAYRAVGCSGMARVDFFVTDEGIILNEINTIPGFTSISMYPKLMANMGIPYEELLDRLIELAIERHGD
ncbi:MAG: D-alanine--D-alanine ligase [Oscillospiraceae bacterium]|nr:D-alanine--D-alanine ligase [Oscillospiraceae bacterium]